jgi:hypothetical protein
VEVDEGLNTTSRGIANNSFSSFKKKAAQLGLGITEAQA